MNLSLLGFYFWGFAIVGPFIGKYFLGIGYKKTGYFVFFFWFCYLCRFILPMLFSIVLFSVTEEATLDQTIFSLFDIFVSIGVLLVFPIAVMTVNFILQLQFTQALVMALVLPAFFILTLESHFIFCPLIDTTHSSEFTLKRFKSITPGMTRQQVVMLIGRPHPSAGGYLGDETGCESQTGDNGPLAKSLHLDFAWLDSVVCYDKNDRVVKTQMNYVPD